MKKIDIGNKALRYSSTAVKLAGAKNIRCNNFAILTIIFLLGEFIKRKILLRICLSLRFFSTTRVTHISGTKSLPIKNYAYSFSLYFLLATSVVAALVAAIYVSLTEALTIPIFHLDGAFQTASGLYRLYAGQHPGKDFFPYLGIGPLYSLYPAFLLAGSNLFSSEFSARLAILIGYAVSVFAIALLSGGKPRHYLFAAAASVTTLLLTMSFPMHVPLWAADMIEPGNSLRPLRALLPYINAIFIYLLIRHVTRKNTKFAALGFVTGCSLLWSNDFALSSALLLMLFNVGYAFTHGASFKHIYIIIGGALISGVGCLLIATQGEIVPLLKYNFIDVRGDQWWYFGPWSPESRVFSIADAYKLFAEDIALPIAVLAGTALLAAFRPRLEYALIMYIGLSLFAGGLIASIGGHIMGYFNAFIFWSKATLIFGCLQLIPTLLNVRGWPNLASRLSLVIIFMLAIFSVLVANIKSNSFLDAKSVAVSDTNQFYVKALGGYLPISWKSYVEEAQDPENVDAIEEYWGIWSAVRRTHSELPVDSVIHALGSTRSKFSLIAESLPPFFVTTRRSFSFDWQPWSISANWWFYKTLLKQYRPEVSSPATLLWRRGAEEDWPVVPCEITSLKAPTIIFDAPGDGYYEVMINYSLTNSETRSVLLVKNNLNYAASINGYLSLDPKASRAEFPVRAFEKGLNELDFRIFAGNNVTPRLSVANCSARKIAVKHPEVFAMKATGETSPFNLTDHNWVNGVARTFSAIFLEYRPEAQRKLSAGKVIEFADGTRRTIIKAEHSGPYLNVFFDGPPLNGTVVGYPHKIIIVSEPEKASEASLDSFYLTDGNWVRGVARRWAGFFVPNQPSYEKKYVIGRTVRFGDGQERKITDVRATGAYINIFVDGEPLDAAKVGSPNTYSVKN